MSSRGSKAYYKARKAGKRWRPVMYIFESTLKRAKEETIGDKTYLALHGRYQDVYIHKELADKLLGCAAAAQPSEQKKDDVKTWTVTVNNETTSIYELIDKLEKRVKYLEDRLTVKPPEAKPKCMFYVAKEGEIVKCMKKDRVLDRECTVTNPSFECQHYKED